MNTHYFEANWHQLKGKVREKFGKLTDDDLLEVSGKVETLVGKLQERYDISLEEAEERVTGLHIDADGMELETDIQGEGNYEAARRYQKAQHAFADKYVDKDADTDDSSEVSSADVERLKREQKARTENYIHRH